MQRIFVTQEHKQLFPRVCETASCHFRTVWGISSGLLTNWPIHAIHIVTMVTNEPVSKHGWRLKLIWASDSHKKCLEGREKIQVKSNQHKVFQRIAAVFSFF